MDKNNEFELTIEAGNARLIIPAVSIIVAMVAVIDGFRWARIGGQTALNMTEIMISVTSVSLLCVFGAVYFRKTEKTFADVI